jgi:hypothetical protein
VGNGKFVERGLETGYKYLQILYILIIVENKPDETHVLEIWETEEEKKLSARDLKQKYFALARKQFNRNPPVVVINNDRDWPIELSRRVISEWRIKSRTRERIISIKLLDKMIEGARFLRTVEDTKGTFGIESVCYFENQCKINGKLFKINITIKQQKSPKRRFAYYYSATE